MREYLREIEAKKISPIKRNNEVFDRKSSLKDRYNILKKEE